MVHPKLGIFSICWYKWCICLGTMFKWLWKGSRNYVLHPQKPPPELQTRLSNCLHILWWESQGHPVAVSLPPASFPSPYTHKHTQTCFTFKDLHDVLWGMSSQPISKPESCPIPQSPQSTALSQVQPSSLPTHLPAFVGPSVLPLDFPKSSLMCLFYAVSPPVHWWHCLWHGPSKTQIWSRYSQSLPWSSSIFISKRCRLNSLPGVHSLAVSLLHFPLFLYAHTALPSWQHAILSAGTFAPPTPSLTSWKLLFILQDLLQATSSMRSLPSPARLSHSLGSVPSTGDTSIRALLILSGPFPYSVFPLHIGSKERKGVCLWPCSPLYSQQLT